MRCPSCGRRVDPLAWICEFCDHILDTSVLGEAPILDVATLPDRTRMVPWGGIPEPHEEDSSVESIPEALILGDVDVDTSEFQIITGQAVEPDEHTSTFLYYAASPTSQLVRPNAIPKAHHRSHTLASNSQEKVILTCTDGRRTVREIRKKTGLGVEEVVVAILSLLEKGAIKMINSEETSETSEASPRPNDYETRAALRSSLAIPYRSGQSHQAAHPRAVQQDAPPSKTVRAKTPSHSGEIPNPLERGQILTVKGMLETPWATEEQITPPPMSPHNLEGDEVNDAITITGNQVPVPTLEDSFLSHQAQTEPRLSPLPSAEHLFELPRHSANQLPVEAWPSEPDPSYPAEEDSWFDVDFSDLLEESERVPEDVIAPLPRRSSSLASGLNPLQTKQAPSPAAVRQRPVRETRKRSPAVKRASVPNSSKSHTPTSEPLSDPKNIVMASKAAKLFEQAQLDQAQGNLISAHMNMKLALTFDPANEVYAVAFKELDSNPKAHATIKNLDIEKARTLYDRATELENRGRYDAAIDNLVKAIDLSRNPSFLNRLGVIYAMRKRDFVQAQALIEEAIELAPGNNVYERNLQKILSMAATSGMNKKARSSNKKSVWSIFGKRKS